jgi:hypothetical protein
LHGLLYLAGSGVIRHTYITKPVFIEVVAGIASHLIKDLFPLFNVGELVKGRHSRYGLFESFFGQVFDLPVLIAALFSFTEVLGPDGLSVKVTV